ncbi:Arc family DNA-binding protein [Rhizobium sp. TH2]|uniref:Arc family DNA-binding protein n=1 Tax=Rhizobium sp. TH2 TaxID=2775403 RepID=UPI002157FB9D|nr:Arc family DNA-binding protein [Rhizobium sp. TH2]UVC08260.1 Arc family DNA-binding protein [Rhizobium sp. TH2]
MARGDYPSSKQDQYVLRFPTGMRDRIKAAAERNGRSMNAEIVATLEGAYPDLVDRHDEFVFFDTLNDLQRDLIQRIEYLRQIRLREFRNEASSEFLEAWADRLNGTLKPADPKETKS